MEDTLRQAFSEVYDILNHLQDDLYCKIPEKIINMIESNRDLRI